MSGIWYLWNTTLKNRLLELKKHPARLVLYLVFALLIVFVIAVSFTTPASELENMRDVREFYAIVGGLFLFLLCAEITKGMSSGASFFEIADVNLLFQSPTSPRTILYYGLVRQMGTSLFVGVFILFQASNLRMFYGVGVGGLFAVFISYCLLMFLGEVLAVGIYSFVSGSDWRRRIVWGIVYAVGALLLAAYLLLLKSGGDFLGSLIELMNLPQVRWVPVAGWLQGLAISLLAGEWLLAGLYFLLCALLFGVLVYLIGRSDADYYEDILQATERNYLVKEAAKEGKVADSRPAGKINLKRTGLGRGRGASVYFFKHLKESRRASPFVLDSGTAVMAVIAIVFSFTMKNEMQLIMIFFMLTYMQLLMSGTGRWVKELMYPYIYMTPEKPLKKLVWSMLESLEGSLLSGVIIFGVCGVILRASIWEVLACILARVCFAAIFAAGNVLIERLFGNVRNKGLIFMAYLLGLMLVILPGVIGGVIVGTMVSIPLGLCVAGTWNLVASAIILFACRDLLHNMETNIT